MQLSCLIFGLVLLCLRFLNSGKGTNASVVSVGGFPFNIWLTGEHSFKTFGHQNTFHLDSLISQVRCFLMFCGFLWFIWMTIRCIDNGRNGMTWDDMSGFPWVEAALPGFSAGGVMGADGRSLLASLGSLSLHGMFIWHLSSELLKCEGWHKMRWHV